MARLQFFDGTGRRTAPPPPPQSACIRVRHDTTRVNTIIEHNHEFHADRPARPRPAPGLLRPGPVLGPGFFESQPDGDIKLRVGDWILSLGAPERKAALRKAKAEGQALNVQDYMARWRDPKTRLAGMDAAGQNAQVVSVPSHCYMYWTPTPSTRALRPQGQ
jgi:hypothetical protein